MSTFKCKMCGGTLEVAENQTTAVCEYCGSNQTVSKTKDEVIGNLFNRANNLRTKSEFDKAQEIYEKIVNNDAFDAEAYWGIVLCKYGIEYVEDPKTFKRVPTCHRTQIESVLTDVDYISAFDNADLAQKALYEAEAKEIDRLQKEILKIAQNEEPFDVFICYKESDENGKRTADSVIANDIYHQLTQEGFKVFYAAITLEDKLGQEYEPYIFAALNSAKVMLVVGSKPEYFNAVWVKNEWSRYLKIIKNDRSKLLIPCYKNMDAYDLPEEFSHLQAQDMGKIGFINDVVRGIKKVVQKTDNSGEPENVMSNSSSSNMTSFLKRAYLFLEGGEWESADEYCEKVLDLEPECAEAYLIKVCAAKQKNSFISLGEIPKNQFSSMFAYQNAVKFADEKLRSTIAEIENTSEQALKEHLEREKRKHEEFLNRFRNKNIQTKLLKNYIPTPQGTVNAGLTDTGSVFVNFSNKFGTEVSTSLNSTRHLKGIVAVDVSWNNIITLNSNGDVDIAGEIKETVFTALRSWQNVVKVKYSNSTLENTMGILADGTVVAFNYDGKVLDNLFKDWTDIIDIVANEKTFAGLKSDGSVVVAGEKSLAFAGVSTWENIAEIAIGENNIYGLCKDGRVFALGNNDYGQCDVTKWENVVSITFFDGVSCPVIFGIKNDGTVLVAGSNEYNAYDVRYWKNIIDIVMDGNYNTIGLKEDGTVNVICKENDVSDHLSKWNDIVAINADSWIVGLKSDGRVVNYDFLNHDWSNIANWKLFDDVDTAIANQKSAIPVLKQRLLSKISAENELLRKKELEKSNIKNSIREYDWLIQKKNTELLKLGMLAFGSKKEIKAEIERLSNERNKLINQLNSLG